METKKVKVKCLSLNRIEEGSIGFMTTTEDGVWYNVLGEPEVLKELTEKVVAKGNTIEFEFNNGVVGSLKLIEKAPEGEKNWADDMTNFEDLLSAAHKKFSDGFNIKTEMISVDYEKSQAIFKATVVVDVQKNREQIFTGHGDAEGITNDKIKPHFIRMAETRSIARALRWATNNAKVSSEETSE